MPASIRAPHRKVLMSHLELSIAEQELLTELLDTSLANLEVEIDRTDRHEYRDALKRRRALMKVLLDKVTVPTPTVF